MTATYPYSELQAKLGFGQALPWTEHWSAAEDFLLLIADHCLTQKPASILECSSGLSTLVLARCCQLNGRGQVLSLENGEEYARATRENLAAFGLASHARVLHAPLSHQQVDDREFQWYRPDESLPATIDMLVVDGPPGFLQPCSRYPALPLLRSRLADGCHVFLDDAARDDEKEIARRWLRENPALNHQYLDFRRGCSVFVLKGKSA
ncbi:O-methyltransferase [Thiolapillus sp.]